MHDDDSWENIQSRNHQNNYSRNYQKETVFLYEAAEIAANAVLLFSMSEQSEVVTYDQRATYVRQVTDEMVVILAIYDQQETVVQEVIAAIYARQVIYVMVEIVAIYDQRGIAAIYDQRAIASDYADSEMATMSHPGITTCNHCVAN